MNIAISSDHAGYEYRLRIIDYLSGKGYILTDYGPKTIEPVDYPDYIRPAAESVANGECDIGIFFVDQEMVRQLWPIKLEELDVQYVGVNIQR